MIIISNTFVQLLFLMNVQILCSIETNFVITNERRVYCMTTVFIYVRIRIS